MRIAHLGTFDVANFGDLLFPAILEQRLRASIEGDLELLHFSPRGGPPVWQDTPRTLPLYELEQRGPFDAVILGGGHLVHALPTRLPDYQDSPSLAHIAYPALWLSAACIAERDGAQLIWNAPGVPRAMLGQAAKLLRAAAARVDYLSVRDQASAKHLRASGVQGEIHVVPDTALGVARLWNAPELRGDYEAIFAQHGRARPERVIVVHAKERFLTEPVEAHAAQLDALSEARQATILLAALGPCHGDDDIARRLGATMRSEPLVIDRPSSVREVAACLAHADVYLGSSLHGLIVAKAFGRPAWCVATERQVGPRKFTGFLRHVGTPERLVNSWREAIEQATVSDPAASNCTNALAQLDDHWRRLNAVLRSPRNRQTKVAAVPAALPRNLADQNLAILAFQAESALHAVGRAERLENSLDLTRRREQAVREQNAALESNLRRSRAAERRLRRQLTEAERSLARRERELTSLSGWIDQLRHGIEALLATRRWRLGNWCGDALNRLARRREPLVTELFRDIFRRHHRWRARRHEELTIPAQPSATATITASIVVPIHNALPSVKNCLASLVAHTDARHELILVDDASDAECRQFLEEFAVNHSQIKLVRHHERLGYTCSANRGWQSAQGDYAVLLNSDTVVTPNWLDHLLVCGESHPAIGLVGPLSNVASWQSVPQCFDSAGDWLVNDLPTDWTVDQLAAALACRAAPSYPRVPLLNGFCLAIKRQVWQAIGHFDEQAFPEGYGEETDFCLRAAAAGYQLAIADNAYVFHAKSQSYGHARRQQLTEAGQQALRRKHGASVLRRAVSVMREEPTLAGIRDRLAKLLAQPRRELMSSAQESLPSVLFLLPVRGGGGGAHSVVQEAAGMRQLGARAQVAIEARFADEFARHYPAWFADGLFFVYADRTELSRFAADFSVVVATVYFSLRLLRHILRVHPQIQPAYYVQDYEPRFFPRFSRHRREARRSYGALPGMIHFAKTAWIRDEVKRRHGVHVHAVTASLDHAVYFPAAQKPQDGPLRIAAMIRPATPYRGADRTLRVLRDVQRRCPQVELHYFGASDAESNSLRAAASSNEHWHGRLTREEVAELLRRSDIFVDLSDFQAFGRTGLEAMACGTAVVLPRDGGTNEFAFHEQNALVVDTSDDLECRTAIERLVADASLRARLATEGLRTAARYSIAAAAQSELELFSRELRRVAGVEGTPSPPVAKRQRRVRTMTSIHPAGAKRIHAILPTSGHGWPGSSYVRALLPLQHPSLAEQLFLTYGDAQSPVPSDASTILVQRTAIPGASDAKTLIAECRNRGRRLMVELDDDLWALPHDHPERNRYRRRLAGLECLLEHADVAIVPTNNLASAIAQRTARAAVIPNALDEQLWFAPMKMRQVDAQTNQNVRFLIMGTRTHAADLEIVAPAARRLRAEFNGRVEFDVIGCVPRGCRADWYRTVRLPANAQAYPRFVRWLRRQPRWHVGLAPLRDEPFNAVKSGIKFLDYSALGLANVVSDVPAYRDVVRQLDTGLLISADADSWFEALRTLVLNHNFRRQLASAAEQHVRANHTLGQITEKWAQLLNVESTPALVGGVS